MSFQSLIRFHSSFCSMSMAPGLQPVWSSNIPTLKIEKANIVWLRWRWWDFTALTTTHYPFPDGQCYAAFTLAHKPSFLPTSSILPQLKQPFICCAHITLPHMRACAVGNGMISSPNVPDTHDELLCIRSPVTYLWIPIEPSQSYTLEKNENSERLYQKVQHSRASSRQPH